MNTTDMQKQAAFDRGFQTRLQQLAAGELEKSAMAGRVGRGLGWMVRKVNPAAVSMGGATQGGNMAGNAIRGLESKLLTSGAGGTRFSDLAKGTAAGGAVGAGVVGGAAEGRDAYRRNQVTNMGLADRLRAAFALITNPQEAAQRAY